MSIQSFDQPYEILLNTNSQGIPVSVLIQNEPHIIYDSCCILSQIPDSYYKVVIENMVEKTLNTELTNATQYKVDYSQGKVYFYSTLEGTSITISSFYGRGYKLLFAKRVKLDDGDNYYVSLDAEGAFKEIYERVSNIIINNPQPSEVVDARAGETILSDRLNKIIIVSDTAPININATDLWIDTSI